MKTDINEIKYFLIDLQNSICNGLENIDTQAKFISDKWQRPEGGGGDTRVIENGAVFEKGGVNFSHVFGTMPNFIKNETIEANFFQATGLSIVIHCQNPFCPIIHMNIRYFEMRKDENSPILDFWFGGGIDVSPAYPNENDGLFFHQYLKETVCDKYDITFYPKFKKWCDEYFYIKHRNEMRGIGGIFFDHLRPKNEIELNTIFEFWKSVGHSFVPIYAQLIQNNRNKEFTNQHKEWQFIRRGRYAEFNLVYDRGTHFGLQTNGRIESILMSLPPMATWKYNYLPDLQSEEAIVSNLFQPKDWF